MALLSLTPTPTPLLQRGGAHDSHLRLSTTLPLLQGRTTLTFDSHPTPPYSRVARLSPLESCAPLKQAGGGVRVEGECRKALKQIDKFFDIMSAIYPLDNVNIDQNS
ncbi:hypothetical protein ALC57_14621 [Trachymyrmex cornetzi]|uniref:Uncharacterized protein n=1 Tax=Trachymyrmex cornetzi TaxID=471704 RepID=A0A151IY62_9HYME|nr:hypothetical protein ALC57_14621 [Trachymyrmex cornetzi]